MDGIALFVMLCFLGTFGPPVLFLIIGIVKQSRKKDSAKIFYILSAAWFLIGGGICASMMMG